MDSTQDPFTRRMLQRAASVRRNREGSLRLSLDDSRRKISILQAIGDKPAKIVDAADCEIGNGTAQTGANKSFAEDKQRTLRRTSLTTSDSLISRRSGFSGFKPNSQSSTSNLADVRSKANDDCENVHDLLRFPKKYADQRKSVGDFGYANEKIDKEDRSRRSFQVTESPARKDEEHRRSKTENDISEDDFINKVMALAKPKNPPRSQDRGTEDMNSSTRSKSKAPAVDDAEFYDRSKNASYLTQTLDHTSLNLTEGNSTKDSITSSTYVKGFELGNVKWRGPLYRASVKSKQKKDEDSLGMKSGIELSSGTFSLDEPELVKVKQKEISMPRKMKAELKTIGNWDKPEVEDSVKDDSRNGRPGKLSLPLKKFEMISRPEISAKFETIPESPNSPMTPLSAEIKRLDGDIKRLEFFSGLQTPENAVKVSPPDRIYPNLSKIEFTPTGYTPKKLYQSPCSPDDPPKSSSSRKPALTGNRDEWNLEDPSRSVEKSAYESRDVKNPNHALQDSNKPIEVIEELQSNGAPAKNKNNKAEGGDNKFKPNMESTRKSSLTDLSKNTGSPCPRESTVSSVTMAPETLGSLVSAETSSPPGGEKNLTMDSTAPYNVDDFLADALGDELYNTTVTYPPSEGHDRSVSQFNASELVSEERTPLQFKKSKKVSKKIPMTEPPPQHTSTFNRTMTIYRSLTQRIKNKLRPGLQKLVPKAVTNDATMTAGDSEDKKIQALIQEANIQQTLMYQANKALTFCRSMKEFAASTEQVESERSLLVAGLRRAAALEEIKRLDCEQSNNNDNELQSGERGEVTIKDFSLPLKEDVLKYEAQAGDFVQWFVIVVTQGATVWATRAVSCPIQSPRIIFNGTFLVPNLSPNFKITVKIYSLKMRRATFNHDDKYHLNQAEKNSRCPSPKKLILRKSDRSLSPKEIQQTVELSAIRNTSFVLSGMVELYLHDLSLAAPWPLTALVPGSVLRGTIDLSLSCKLHLSVSHAGFVTHGDEAGGLATWNRRWCVLRGQTLKFWNYPCDQEDKEPLAVIDLTNCISEEINVVDRSLCAKPRTLLIETTRRRSILDRNSMLLECRLSCTIIRNLLCCDTARDFSQWKSKLNHVVSALRDWNITKRPRDVQVSDL